MGLGEKLKQQALKTIIDKAMGPFDEVLAGMGVDVADVVAGAVSGGLKMPFGEESYEDISKRIADTMTPKAAEQVGVILGEHVLPEASRFGGDLMKNKYDTLSRVMAAMQGRTSQNSRDLFGSGALDTALSAARAVAERKGANWKSGLEHLATGMEDSVKYKHKIADDTRSMQIAADPSLEGRGGVLQNTRMITQSDN